MRMLLRDLAPGQQYAMSFRSNDGAGNVSDWSQVQRFTTTNDTTPPADVLNLSWYNSGTSFIGQWDKVTSDSTGGPLKDFRDYHCNVTNGSTAVDFYVTNEYFEFTTAQNIAAFGTLQTALTLSVRARDLTYNESPHPAVIVANPLAPPVPSTPSVSNYLGLLMVSWDSLTSAGANMYQGDHNFNYCEVHVSTVNGFTPDGTTMVGRVFGDGSGSKYVVSGLTPGVVYYVRLIAVDLLGKKSGPSGIGSGTPGRISGLDIENGQITAEQINWTSTNIPGGDAYYGTSQPTDPIGDAFKVGDVWYDTDNGYQSYSWNGTTWVLDASIGFIPGGKIIAGTITADKVGANQIITASANIADAVIDDAKIQNLNVAKLLGGSISADQFVSAGPMNGMHAEMRSTGFYVMVPAPNYDAVTNPILLPQIKMGTGDGDNFSIVDPNSPDSTLASVDTNGIGSFQGLRVEQDPIIQGQSLVGGLIKSKSQLVQEGYVGPITGLAPAGAMGIRGEYGIGQFNFQVEAGRTYEIYARLAYLFTSGNGEPTITLRFQKDQRTPADIQNGVAPTAATISSPVLIQDFRVELGYTPAYWHSPVTTAYYRADFTGTLTIGYSLSLANPGSADAVLKIIEGSDLTFKAFDCGRSTTITGGPNTYGQSLYSWTAPPPPPPPTVQNYSWSGHANWVRSYKGTGAWMTNTNGLAYQGQDPSGYNGNQRSHYGFSQVDFASMLAGASNIHITLYLYYAHWYNNSGGTAVIGYHSNFGDPGTANASGAAYNLTQVGGVPKPGSFNIDVSGWAGAMQNGSFRGIALGPGPSSSYTYYGYASDCALTVSYTK